MNPKHLITIAMTASLAGGVATGVWALAGRGATGQQAATPSLIGDSRAAPAYIVVNKATQVLFTTKLTDRQLKTRSAVLVRLGADGKPSDILGRLHDDGRNGDVKAADSIYTLRVSLNEPTVGTLSFAVAARFKPGRWTEPEADDDDWDFDLAALFSMRRDAPATGQRRRLLLARFLRYTLSSPINVGVWNQQPLGSGTSSIAVPPTLFAPPAVAGDDRLFFFSSAESAQQRAGNVLAVTSETLTPGTTIQAFVNSHGGDTSSISPRTFGTQNYFAWREDLGDGMVTLVFTQFIGSSAVSFSTRSSSFATSAELSIMLASLSAR